MTAVLGQTGQRTDTLDLAVEGMTCGSCAAHVRRTLERRDEVAAASMLVRFRRP